MDEAGGVVSVDNDLGQSRHRNCRAVSWLEACAKYSIVVEWNGRLLYPLPLINIPPFVAARFRQRTPPENPNPKDCQWPIDRLVGLAWGTMAHIRKLSCVMLVMSLGGQCRKKTAISTNVKAFYKD